MTGRDPLTGCLSRETWEPLVLSALAVAERDEGHLSVLLVDLDRFKSINDAFGHARGDEVLKEVAHRLLATVRDQDQVFRYGGDEFLMLCPDTPSGDAGALANRLISAVAREPIPGDPPLNVGLSIGVGSFPQDGRSPEELFSAADRRLYQAKHAGRGRVSTTDSPSTVGFDRQSRLLDRDEEKEVAVQLLRRCREDRGLLDVAGPEGAGRTRFLAEVCDAGRLLGYHIAVLRGNRRLPGRGYEGIRSARGDATALFGPDAPLPETLEPLLIGLDDVEWLDPESLDAVTRLLDHRPRGVVVVIRSPTHPLPLDSEDREVRAVELKPFSPEATQAWLRETLQREPSAAMIEAFQKAAGGLPGLMRRALETLDHEGRLDSTLNAADAAPPVRSALEPPRRSGSRLRRPVRSIIGREREIGAVKRALRSSALVTISGPGGIGKSRLALQVAIEEERRGEREVGVVDGTPAGDATQLAELVAKGVGVHLDRSPHPWTELAQALQGRSRLIVLDQLDELTDVADELVRLLSITPELKVLITSRGRLNVANELVVRLEGLPVSTGQSAGTGDAQTLFLSRLRRNRDLAATSDEDPEVVRSICSALDGNPLGLELAASLAASLSCEEVAEELRAGAALSTTLRDVPERQRSLLTVWESSWRLLSEGEREALWQVAVFPAGIGAAGIRRATTIQLSTLASLVDRSLLQRSETGIYTFHGAYRAFALRDIPDDLRQRIEERLVSHYLEVLAAATRRPGATRRDTAEATLDREYPNVEAALELGVAQGRFELVGDALDAALRLFRALGQWQRGTQLLETLAEEPAAPTLLRSRFALGAAALLIKLAAYDRADQKLADADRWSAAADPGRDRVVDQPDLGQAVEVKARLAALRGALHLERAEFSAAQPQLAWAAALYDRLDDHEELTSVRNQQARLAMARGRFRAAKRLLTRVIARAPHGSHISSWMHLGVMENVQGMHVEAAARFQTALEVARSEGDSRQEHAALTNLGYTELMKPREEGDMQRAESLLLTALGYFERVGWLRARHATLCSLAELRLRTDAIDAAVERLIESGRIARRAGSSEMLNTTRVESAYLLLHLNRPELAAALTERVRPESLDPGVRQRLEQVRDGCARIPGPDRTPDRVESLPGIPHLLALVGGTEAEEVFAARDGT